jgi:hypothetical protein
MTGRTRPSPWRAGLGPAIGLALASACAGADLPGLPPLIEIAQALEARSPERARMEGVLFLLDDERLERIAAMQPAARPAVEIVRLMRGHPPTVAAWTDRILAAKGGDEIRRVVAAASPDELAPLVAAVAAAMDPATPPPGDAWLVLMRTARSRALATRLVGYAANHERPPAKAPADIIAPLIVAPLAAADAPGQVRLLGLIGGGWTAAPPPAILALARSPSAEVRRALAVALQDADPQHVLPTLLTLMADADAEVRERAARCLRLLRPALGPDRLAALVADAALPDAVRSGLIQAAAGDGGLAIGQLVDLAQGTGEAALAACDAILRDGRVEALAERIGRVPAARRPMVLQALAAADHPAAIAALAADLAQSDQRIALDAVALLEAAASDGACRALVARLKDPRPAIAEQIRRSLVSIAECWDGKVDDAAWQAWAERHHGKLDDDRSAELAAARRLLERPDRAAPPPPVWTLARLARGRHGARAIEALRDHPDPAATTALVEMAVDPSLARHEERIASLLVQRPRGAPGALAAWHAATRRQATVLQVAIAWRDPASAATCIEAIVVRGEAVGLEEDLIAWNPPTLLPRLRALLAPGSQAGPEVEGRALGMLCRLAQPQDAPLIAARLGKDQRAEALRTLAGIAMRGDQAAGRLLADRLAGPAAEEVLQALEASIGGGDQPRPAIADVLARRLVDMASARAGLRAIAILACCGRSEALPLVAKVAEQGGDAGPLLDALLRSGPAALPAVLAALPALDQDQTSSAMGWLRRTCDYSDQAATAVFEGAMAAQQKRFIASLGRPVAGLVVEVGDLGGRAGIVPLRLVNRGRAPVAIASLGPAASWSADPRGRNDIPVPMQQFPVRLAPGAALDLPCKEGDLRRTRIRFELTVQTTAGETIRLRSVWVENLQVPALMDEVDRRHP